VAGRGLRAPNVSQRHSTPVIRQRLAHGGRKKGGEPEGRENRATADRAGTLGERSPRNATGGAAQASPVCPFGPYGPMRRATTGLPSVRVRSRLLRIVWPLLVLPKQGLLRPH
jgi:hypothetical protein